MKAKFLKLREGFKPQRGKFTRTQRNNWSSKGNGFKPQRGKFTPRDGDDSQGNWNVSNPNGVNLHLMQAYTKGEAIEGFKPQRGKFTLELLPLYGIKDARFQTPTG